MDSEAGAMAVRKSSEFLEQWAPSWHASIAKLSARVYGSPSGRTLAEWILLNKILAPISFPTKMWFAHQIVERRHAATRDETRDEGALHTPKMTPSVSKSS